MSVTTIERQLGVTILAILHFLAGIGLLILGLLIAAVGGYAASVGEGALAAIFGASGFIIILIGLIPFGIGWGLWNLKKWSYQVAMIFTVIFFILGILSIPAGFLFFVIVALILYYLTRPEIKDVFGITGFLS